VASPTIGGTGLALGMPFMAPPPGLPPGALPNLMEPPSLPGLSLAPMEAAAAAMAAAGGPVEEEHLLLEKFPPYSRVLLCDLMKNFELNGQFGVVVPQSVSQWPEVPGCLKVRLSAGQEIAVKPSNMRLVT